MESQSGPRRFLHPWKNLPVTRLFRNTVQIHLEKYFGRPHPPNPHSPLGREGGDFHSKIIVMMDDLPLPACGEGRAETKICALSKWGGVLLKPRKSLNPPLMKKSRNLVAGHNHRTDPQPPIPENLLPRSRLSNPSGQSVLTPFQGQRYLRRQRDPLRPPPPGAIREAGENPARTRHCDRPIPAL